MSKLIYVPSEGSALNCRLFIIGEAPGEEEERARRPFVGRSGKFLRETLRTLGVSEKEVYFTNAVKVRPENNRKPTITEISSWLDALTREFAYACNPTMKIITLGRSAEFAVKCLDREAHHVIHPSYALRFNKKNDFILSIKEILESVD